MPHARIGIVALSLFLTLGCHHKSSDGPPLAPSAPVPFNQARGFDGPVGAVITAGGASGDVYVAGAFTTFTDVPAGRIIRLNADGTRDVAFSTGTGFDNTVTSLALDPSGDVYAGGTFGNYNGSINPKIVRLHSDGTIDATFVVGSGFLGTVYSIALAKDGSGDLYVGGSVTSYKGTAVNKIIRLNSNGSIDAGFVVGAGFDQAVNAVCPATDGSGDIYVGGQFTTYQAVSGNRLVRLNSDGTRDAGFAVGTGCDNAVEAITVATDGSGDVYVGGNFANYNGGAAPKVMRVNSNGTIDGGFAPGTGANSDITTIACATDGSGDVYLGGGFFSYHSSIYIHIVRANSDGTPDLGFDPGTGATSTVYAIAACTDGTGDVYAGGDFAGYDDVAQNRLVRINADGSRDAANVAGSGFALNGGSGYASLVAVDASGDVYVAGAFSHYGGLPAPGIARVNPDGTRDAAFVEGTGFNGPVLALAVAVDGSGDVYVAGGFTTYKGTPAPHIVRLNADGSIDAAFVTGTGPSLNVYALAAATDGSGDLYVAGAFTTYNGSAAARVMRLNSDGTLDAGFAVGAGCSSSVFALAVAVDGSGDVYAGGTFATYQGVASAELVRINSNGSLDAVFAVGSGLNGAVNIVAPAVDGSGDVYIGGAFSMYGVLAAGHILRLNGDGSADLAFAVGVGFDAAVGALLPASDGSGDIYVGGDFTTYKGTPAVALARLNADGGLDAGFATVVQLIYSGSTVSGYALASPTDGSGDVYVGGNFSNINNVTVDSLAKLSSGGSVR